MRKNSSLKKAKKFVKRVQKFFTDSDLANLYPRSEEIHEPTNFESEFRTHKLSVAYNRLDHDYKSSSGIIFKRAN